MVFEKPSLRTRVSFDVAAYQLGGHAIYLSPQEIGLGTREPIGDIARTLEGLVQAVMVRTFAHRTVARLAEAAAIPVINGLSDLTHPCQALADFLTMREVFGGLDGLTLAYVGDSNNVTDALIAGAALLGVRMRVASPAGFAPREDVLAWARRAVGGFRGGVPGHVVSRRSRPRRRRRLHRHVGEHGPGGGSRPPDAWRSPASR